MFSALALAWDIIATIALLGAVALALGALWAIVKWWDDRDRD